MMFLRQITPPSEGIRFEGKNTEAVVSKVSVGKGTLYIAESALSWVNDSSGEGFTLEYPSISVHAVSRDLSTFPSELLFVMLDRDLNAKENGSSSESESSGTGDDPSSEVYFIPDDKSVLQDMYQAMSHCQSLHPDEDQSNSGRPTTFGTIAPARFLWNLTEEFDPVTSNPNREDEIGYLDDNEQNGGECDGDEGEFHPTNGGGDGRHPDDEAMQE